MGTDNLKSLWHVEEPMILASTSAARQKILSDAGIPYEAIGADVDEREIERDLGKASPDEVARTLASAKAMKLSNQYAHRLVLGADQVASCEGRIFGKPQDKEQARTLLLFLSGRRHRLHSAITLMRNGKIIFENISHADLTVRKLSENFIETYLLHMGDKVLTTAGGYQIEGLGAQLFSDISGDHWTIMGMPLLTLLETLRVEGLLSK